MLIILSVTNELEKYSDSTYFSFRGYMMPFSSEIDVRAAKVHSYIIICTSEIIIYMFFCF